MIDENDYGVATMEPFSRLDNFETKLVLSHGASDFGFFILHAVKKFLKAKTNFFRSDETWSDHPGTLCTSRVELARPRRMLNVEHQWRVIVNDGSNFQQTIRLETCLKVCRHYNYL